MCLQVLTSWMMRRTQLVRRSFSWQRLLWFRWFFQCLLDVTFKIFLQDQGQVLLGRCDNYAFQFFKRAPLVFNGEASGRGGKPSQSGWFKSSRTRLPWVQISSIPLATACHTLTTTFLFSLV